MKNLPKKSRNYLKMSSNKKSMRKSILINIISVIVILLSVSAWYFLLPRFLDERNGIALSSDEVKVEGVRTFSKKGATIVRADNSVTFGELLSFQPDAPIRSEAIGDTYMRARSAIAIDANTGTILHYQDGKKRMAIASLTKIMTAVIVVEYVKDLDGEIATICSEAVLTDGTKVGCPNSGYCISNRLQVGEKVSVRNLLEAMLISSANDAAVSLALHISGSQKEFAKLMNDKAKELGLTDTVFCNPSGLDEEDKPNGCYSTAYDIARIAAYSLRYDEIWNCMSVKEKEVFSEDGAIMHRLINTDVLLDELPNCLGGKTGFTYEAGRSLMMTAHHPMRKEHKVIVVLLDDNYRWLDMRIIFDWVFRAYGWSLN